MSMSFKKNNLSVEFGSISSLFDFTRIREADIEITQKGGVKFRIPNKNNF